MTADRAGWNLAGFGQLDTVVALTTAKGTGIADLAAAVQAGLVILVFEFPKIEPGLVRGARHQVTFYNEPIGGVERQPGGAKVIFTRDAGGSEFSQVFVLDPEDGTTTMLTDGG